VNMCHKDSERKILSISQHKQCTALMEDLCQLVEIVDNPPPYLEPPSVPSSVVSSSCSDDPDYRFKNKKWASCEQIFGKGEFERKMDRKSKRRTCRKFDKGAEQFVFEKCRKSCRSCTCKDNEKFYFNDDPAYNCTWVKGLESKKKKEVCKKKVGQNCKDSCSMCCKDNPSFTYWEEIETDVLDEQGSNMNKWKKHSCKSITSANWREECKKRKIAINCPMKCRKCLIQPK